MPFTSFDRVFGGSLGLSEAMGGAEHPVLGDQSSAANVLRERERERERDDDDDVFNPRDKIMSKGYLAVMS